MHVYLPVEVVCYQHRACPPRITAQLVHPGQEGKAHVAPLGLVRHHLVSDMMDRLGVFGDYSVRSYQRAKAVPWGGGVGGGS